MANTNKYPGVLQVTKNTFKLTITDGYTEIIDELGNKKKQQKRYFKTVTAKTAKEAADLRAEWITEVKGGAVLTNNRMTLKQYYAYFKKHAGKKAPKTWQFYDYIFERIDTALGHHKLNDINPDRVRAFLKNLTEAGVRIDPNEKKKKEKPTEPADDSVKKAPPKKDTLSPNTVYKYFRVLNILFNHAVKWGLASFNPCKRVDTPETERHQRKIYDEETTGRFLTLLENEEISHRAMALLALSSGMRRGELFGLQWRHVNLDTGVVHIEQANQYLPGVGIFTKDPKTENSIRDITIPLSVCDLLKKHKLAQAARRLKLGLAKEGGKWAGAEEQKDDFLFTKWDGRPAPPDNFNRWLQKFVTDNNLPPLHPHALRHMAATYLITSGVDHRTVAGKLGHDVQTLNVVYSHLLKSAEKETADKMESFLQQATEKAKEKQN